MRVVGRSRAAHRVRMGAKVASDRGADRGYRAQRDGASRREVVRVGCLG